MSDQRTRQEQLAHFLRSGEYGPRHDPMAGRKGTGYFGPLMTSEGDAATELSFDYGGDDKPTLSGRGVHAPLIVPTLTGDELRTLLGGGKPTDEIYDKAEQHATERRIMGRSPFAKPLEIRGLPK